MKTPLTKTVLFLLLAALPIITATALISSRLHLSPRAAEVTTPTSVAINPGQIASVPNATPVAMSALAYDASLQPIWFGVTYEWGMSSTGVGNLIPNGNLATFIPQTAGSGHIWTRATNSSGQALGSAQVLVSVPPTPTPTGRYARVLSPNGGETLQQGTTYQITWATSPDITSISLLYIYSTSSSGGTYIVRNIPNTGYYDWNVSITASATASAKIELEAHHSAGFFTDRSDNYFTILPTPTATPTPQIQTATLTPIADSYVHKGHSTKNYGSSSTLLIDGSPIKITYLKFDLSSLAGKSVTSAQLRFKVTNPTGATQSIKRVSDTAWTESALTYQNRPLIGTLIASNQGGSTGSWKEIDITPAIAENLGQLFSLAIDSTSKYGFGFSSRETTDKPQLVITYQP